MFAALAAVSLLAGCGGAETGTVQSAGPPPPSPRHASRLPPLRRPLRQPPPAAQALVMPGLEGVIGATAPDLARQFGAARLDVWEGDARKLQFTASACVLDIYLYPGAPGREPQATYVDARRSSDGKDVDRAGCVSALRQRSGSPLGPLTP
jgi:hypothetical protein